MASRTSFHENQRMNGSYLTSFLLHLYSLPATIPPRVPADRPPGAETEQC